jgi:hypothetical protein
MGIEKNLRASFRDVKLEMISIKNQILRLAESQNDLKKLVNNLQADLKKKKTTKKPKKSKKK